MQPGAYGHGLKRKKVLCRNSRPLTIACHMKKKVKSLFGEAFSFVVAPDLLNFLLLVPYLLNLVPFSATVVDDVKVQRAGFTA